MRISINEYNEYKIWYRNKINMIYNFACYVFWNTDCAKELEVKAQNKHRINLISNHRLRWFNIFLYNFYYHSCQIQYYRLRMEWNNSAIGIKKINVILARTCW